MTKRIGLELILPLAATLPFERHMRWAQAAHKRGKFFEGLLGRAAPLAAVLTNFRPPPGPLSIVLGFLRPSLTEAADLLGSKLKEANADALAKQDYLRAALTGFRIELDNAEEEQVLLRSQR